MSYNYLSFYAPGFIGMFHMISAPEMGGAFELVSLNDPRRRRLKGVTGATSPELFCHDTCSTN